MTGGKISGNIVEGNTSAIGGGGVMLGNQGTMTFSGGEISGNRVISSGATHNASGAGVYIYRGTLTMTGGNIFGNTGIGGNETKGGGVRISSNGSAFIMNGGTIGGNTVRGSNGEGGGVYADSGMIFQKIPVDDSSTSGTIYGSGEGANSNKVENSAGEPVTGRGNAVGAPSKWSDITLGPDDTFVFPPE
jgi:hypothetical protein